MYQKIIILIYLSISLEATDSFLKNYFFVNNGYEAYEINNSYFTKKTSLEKDSKKAFIVTSYSGGEEPLTEESIKTIQQYSYDDLEVGGSSRALCYITHKKNIIYIQTSEALSIYDIKNRNKPIELGFKNCSLDDPGYDSWYMFVSFILDENEAYWYGSLADNTFNILNVSNPKKIKSVFQQKLGLPIEEILLSKNEKYLVVQVSSEKTREVWKSFLYIYRLDKNKKAVFLKEIKDERKNINAYFYNNDKDICIRTDDNDLIYYSIQKNTVRITKSLYSLCKSTGIKESEIRALNPWINKKATNIPPNAEIIIPNLSKEESNESK